MSINMGGDDEEVRKSVDELETMITDINESSIVDEKDLSLKNIRFSGVDGMLNHISRHMDISEDQDDESLLKTPFHDHPYSKDFRTLLKKVIKSTQIRTIKGYLKSKDLSPQKELKNKKIQANFIHVSPDSNFSFLYKEN